MSAVKEIIFDRVIPMAEKIAGRVERSLLVCPENLKLEQVSDYSRTEIFGEYLHSFEKSNPLAVRIINAELLAADQTILQEIGFMSRKDMPEDLWTMFHVLGGIENELDFGMDLVRKNVLIILIHVAYGVERDLKEITERLLEEEEVPSLEEKENLTPLDVVRFAIEKMMEVGINNIGTDYWLQPDEEVVLTFAHHFTNSISEEVVPGKIYPEEVAFDNFVIELKKFKGLPRLMTEISMSKIMRGEISPLEVFLQGEDLFAEVVQELFVSAFLVVRFSRMNQMEITKENLGIIIDNFVESL